MTCLAKEKNLSFHNKAVKHGGYDYLQLRNGIYSFRYIFPQHIQEKYSRKVIKISLQTAYRQHAKALALSMYVKLRYLLGANASFTQVKDALTELLLSSTGAGTAKQQTLRFADFAALPSSQQLHSQLPWHMTAEAISLSSAIAGMADAKLSDGIWRAHTKDDHLSRLKHLLEYFGEDRDITTITPDEMREFRDTLRKLPPNYNKIQKFKNKTVYQLALMNHEKTMSENRVKNLMVTASSLFEWFVQKGTLVKNPAKALVSKKSKRPLDEKPPFSKSDLEAIFSHPDFIKNKLKKPSYFWVPLIGLFTGMRLEEICQLHCADIYQVDDLWVIDCNSNDGKKLKNLNANRVIPIHDELVKLGLLDYHQQTNAQGYKRLFPELSITDKTTKYGKQPAKKFKDVIKKLSLDDKKSFNSLRHTFADYFKNNRIADIDAFDYVFGHEIKRLAASRYGGRFKTETTYKEVISKLNYGIDLGKLLGSTVE